MAAEKKGTVPIFEKMKIGTVPLVIAGTVPLVIAVVGCAPLRVDIAEQPAGGFLATAHGEDAEACRDARARAAEEARYHCQARGAKASLGKMASDADGAGCRVELPFWCTGASR